MSALETRPPHNEIIIKEALPGIQGIVFHYKTGAHFLHSSQLPEVSHDVGGLSGACRGRQVFSPGHPSQLDGAESGQRL